jgi:hypothetical protein
MCMRTQQKVLMRLTMWGLRSRMRSNLGHKKMIDSRYYKELDLKPENTMLNLQC